MKVSRDKGVDHNLPQSTPSLHRGRCGGRQLWDQAARPAPVVRHPEANGGHMDSTVKTTVLEAGGLHWATSAAVVENVLARRPDVLGVKANAVAPTATVRYDSAAPRWRSCRAGYAIVATTVPGSPCPTISVIQWSSLPILRRFIQLRVRGMATMRPRSVPGPSWRTPSPPTFLSLTTSIARMRAGHRRM